MDLPQKQAFIRQKAAESLSHGKTQMILWSRHAIVELVNDGLQRSDVENALTAGEIIEDYPVGHRPLPDCLMLGMLPDGRPMHCVIAIDMTNDRLLIVTVYIPSGERWNDDWRTRK